MEKLSYSNFYKKTRFHINTNINAFSSMRNFDYEIDYDVYLPSYGINLQRDFCWTLHQKSELIKSILKRTDVGKLQLVHHEHRVFQVIDGKQRLSTVLDFVNNKFPIHFEGKEYYFDDLDKMCQYEIYSWSPRADVGYSYDGNEITDDEKIEWFLRVNFAGTSQEQEHQDKLSKILK